MSQLSITVETTDAVALNRASLMLSGLANDTSNEKTVQIVQSSDCNNCENNLDADTSHIEATIPVSEGGTMMPELDKAGFPHDARIHGEAKKQTAKDGRWTVIKNLEKNQPGLFDTVIAELTAAGFGNVESQATTTTNVTDINANKAPAPGPATAPPPQTTAPAPAHETTEVIEASYIAGDGVTYTETQLRVAGHTDETLTTLQKVVPETATTTVVTFPELMALITPAQAAGTITPADITAALAPHGLTSLPLLSAQPQLVPAVKQALFG